MITENNPPMEFERKFFLTADQYCKLTENPQKRIKSEYIEQGYVEKKFNIYIVQSQETHVNTGNGVFIRTPEKIPFHLMQANGATIDTSKCAARFRKTEGLRNTQETVYELEIKHKTSKGMEEYSFKIPQSDFSNTIEKCDAHISKTREYVKWGDKTLHIDTFFEQAGCIEDEHRTQSLHVLEIEFDSLEEMKNFKPPEEFGIEAKGKQYSNHNFAKLKTVACQFYNFIRTINEELKKKNPNL